MENPEITNSISILDDEKASLVMLYTKTSILIGSVIIKKQFKTSTWLQTVAMPDFVTLHNCKMLESDPQSPPRFTAVREIHIPISQVNIFHLSPPEREDIELDMSAENMQTLNVRLSLGIFTIDGSIQISSKIKLSQYLDVTKEVFYSVYNATIQSPHNENLGKIKVPFAIVRIHNSLLSIN